MFITFEGPEGSGKTTQIGLLAAALRSEGYSLTVSREPGGTALGESLRAILLERDEPVSREAEAYLMTGARAEHVREVIRPALIRGDVVLCDRYVDSTLAYQGAGRGIELGVLRSMQELAVGDVIPTLTLLFDLPVAVGLARRHGGGYTNRLDRESVAFHERVASWYRDEAARYPDRWVIMDATLRINLLHTAVLEQVTERLGVVDNGRVAVGMEQQ